MTMPARVDLPDGFYECLVDGTLAKRLSDQGGQSCLRDLETADSADDRHAALLAAVRHELAVALEAATDGRGIEAELELYLRTLRAIRTSPEPVLARPLRLLTALGGDATSLQVEPPRTGLTRPWLFTAGRHEPSLIDELRRELGSVDHVDILVSFIRWEGVRRIMDLVQAATSLDGDGRTRTRFRIITTTYIGATELRALDWLAQQPGVEVRISLDGRRTRLHAKAWMFRRSTGYGSAYVGSANLTGAALAGGLEWTVKTTQAAEPELFATAVAHFETLWDDPEFTAYNPADADQRDAVQAALTRERGGPSVTASEAPIAFFALQPKAYQQAILDRLAAERRHGRHRNLVVAATGTGKTVIAAFDYLATCQEMRGRPRLLFIAHRTEILQQARATFIQVLREPGFGGLCADGREPDDFDHCFCTIQSFVSKDLVVRCGSAFWHTVIIDECHHLAADSYQALAALRPAVLLGLTATPERADGKPIDDFFQPRPDGSPAAELRLWEALDQQLLSPFEYYGCEDDTDLTLVRWDRAGNEVADLDRILTGNHQRAETAIAAIERFVAEPARMRALAFCVSVAHAHFMAERFRARGWQAAVVTGETDAEERRRAPARLASGELQVVCTCDLYNEGIDIPAVDTLLLLRPTQSPVLIQQQLGRGLRLSPGKESCLIIDLVGRHRVEFRCDRLLGLLSGLPRSALTQAVEHGFGRLPPGCHIHLDRIPRAQVLRNLQQLTITSWRHLIAETKAWMQQGPSRRTAGLATFLSETGVELAELYRGGSAESARGWAALRRACGVELRPPGGEEAVVSRRLPNLLDQDDPALLATARRLAQGDHAYEAQEPTERRRIDALAAELFPGRQDAVTGRALAHRIADMPALREEIAEVAAVLEAGNDLAPRPVPGLPSDWPFVLHAGYHLRTISLFTGLIAADSRHLPREGVVRFPDQRIELLLVTLDKSDGFSTRTAYRDYAISPERFHWQSQNSAGPATVAGRRYLHGGSEGWIFQLFVRETKAHLYKALGPVSYESHEGERPMSITWRLKIPLLLALFKNYSVLRGG